MRDRGHRSAVGAHGRSSSRSASRHRTRGPEIIRFQSTSEVLAPRSRAGSRSQFKKKNESPATAMVDRDHRGGTNTELRNAACSRSVTACAYATNKPSLLVVGGFTWEYALVVTGYSRSFGRRAGLSAWRSRSSNRHTDGDGASSVLLARLIACFTRWRNSCTRSISLYIARAGSP